MSTLNNIELQERLSNDLERMELQFGHTLSKAALFGLVALPLIPGLLTMISIGVYFPELLHIPPWVAWTFGFFAMTGIEVLGLFSIRLALRMRKYNQQAKTKGLDHAPIGQGYAAAGSYIATVMALTVLLKIWPDFAVWSLIPLGLMGALADWVFALNGDHNERESVLRKLILEAEEAEKYNDEIDQMTARIEQLTVQLSDKTAQLDSALADQQAAQLLVTELTRSNSKLTSDIEQLNSRLDSQAGQLTAQIEHLTEQLALSSGRVEILESDQQDAQVLADELTKLNTELTSEIDQLTSEIVRLTAQSTEQSGAQTEQFTGQSTGHFAAQRIVQLQPAKVYSNGDIVHGTEHLDTTGQIQTIAQRMVDSGQKVNKSKISDLLGCSRTTVQTALRDWEPVS